MSPASSGARGGESALERSGPRWRIAAALVVLAAVLLRFHPFLSLDGSVVEHDWYHLHQVDGTHIELAAEEGWPLPFWTPHVLGGTALFAVPTKAFSYPPYVIGVLLLGPVLAMNVLLLLHLFAGGFGAALLARRLDLGGMAPPLCGALFVLTSFPANGFVTTPFSFGYAVAWWPYTLLVLLDMLEGKRVRRAGVLLGVLLALQFHAGGEASLLWLACFSAAFSLPFLFRRWTRAHVRSLLDAALLAGLVFAGLAAVKLLPALEWMGASARGDPLGVEFARDSAVEAHFERMGYGSRFETLGVMLAEQYRGEGLLAICAAIALGLLVGCRKRAWLALTAGTLFTFLLASGTLHEWAYELLPGYDRMRRHSRFIHVVGFGLVFLAGYGLQWRLPRARWASAALAALVAIAILADTSSLPGLRHDGPLLRSASERTALTQPVLEPVVQDARISRIHHEGFREQPTWIDLGLESSSGALGGPRSGNRVYGEFLPERTNAKTLESGVRGVLDVLNVRYLLSYSALDAKHLDLVAGPEDLSAETLQRYQEAKATPTFLYRRATVRERACLVDRPTLVVGDPGARRLALHEILGSGSFDAHAGVYVEHGEPEISALVPADLVGFGMVLFAGRNADDPDLAPFLRAHPAGILFDLGELGCRWRPAGVAGGARVEPLEDARISKSLQAIDVDVGGRSGDFLLLSERLTLSPGWTATIDGEEAPMLRADGLVTLLRLPPGARHVRFVYRAPGFALGAWITGATLLVLTAVVVVRARSA